jgi:uncharacterized protein (DUF2141 family)
MPKISHRGTYALAVIHDENVNGKLDNWLGGFKERLLLFK